MRTRAVILKKMPLREDDELIVAYSEGQGKQRYLAKSSMRSESLQGSHLDILNEVEFRVVEGKKNMIIASGMAIRTFPMIKSSLRKIAIASMILEAFDVLVYENDPDTALWGYLISSLGSLENGNYDDRDIETSLVRVLGYHKSQRLEDIMHKPSLSLQFMKSVV